MSNKSVIDNAPADVWGTCDGMPRFAKSKQYWGDKLQKNFTKLNVDITILGYYRKLDTVKKFLYVECRCNTCGHIWKRLPSALSNTDKPCDGCMDINKKKEYIASFEEIHGQGRFSYIDWRIVKQQQQVFVECNFCGHTWWTLTNNHKGKGAGCEHCSEMYNVYNIHNAEKFKPIWLKEPFIVYTIYCYDDYESFYKIGVTKNTVNQRFSSHGTLPYYFLIIDVIYTNMYEGIYKEKALHRLNGAHKYKPIREFGGHTECFNKVIHLESSVLDFDDIIIEEE